MNTTLLRQALLNASVNQLGEIIDLLDRPWERGKNDALRAAWHEARRSGGARRALAFAIEEEIQSLAPGRDAAHVAGRLGLAVDTPVSIVNEIVARYAKVTPFPLPIPPELIAAALRSTADIARLVLGTSSHGRRRHRGRRYHHGR